MQRVRWLRLTSRSTSLISLVIWAWEGKSLTELVPSFRTWYSILFMESMSGGCDATVYYYLTMMRRDRPAFLGYKELGMRGKQETNLKLEAGRQPHTCTRWTVGQSMPGPSRQHDLERGANPCG